MHLVTKANHMQYKPERIAKRREFVGLTQVELASKVGITGQQISKIERGLVMPSAATLISLAEALSCSVDYLLGRVEKPELGMDLDTIERDLILRFRAKQENLVTTTLNQQFNKIAQPTRDHIIRLVKFFLKNPGQVDDISDDT